MKKQTHKTFWWRSGLSLALVLGVWSLLQPRSNASAGEKSKKEAVESKSSRETQESKSEAAQVAKKGFVGDIDQLTVKNNDFRRVVYTAEHCQLVLMSLKPKEEIGEESHKPDQFFRVEAGSGEVVLNGVRTAIRAGSAIVVPSGAMHNIINTGEVSMKLYTIYAPPNHQDGVIRHTRKDTVNDHEHFDGKTTE
jgi:mannose-6-phosphate isomerase-like protein (cupin superfamily)